MGKRRYRQGDVSKQKTKALGIGSLLALKTSTDTQIEAVHKRYFLDDKLACPACGSTKTRCSKVLRRSFKDILWGPVPEDENERQSFQVIDLVFYQRYLRCDSCNSSVFPEPIDFGDKGSRYTNRLSDALAEGTFRYSYKKVCAYYGVPASTASIGPIMRRRIQCRESLLLPLYTPAKLGIIELTFFRQPYAVAFAIRDDGIYCIDILPDSAEETVLAFLRTLDGAAVQTVYIDPVDSIRNASATAMPGADIVLSGECILRYARNAMIEIIHTDGKRFPIKFKDNALTIPNRHLPSDRDRRQVDSGMASRPRLKVAYDVHQALMDFMEGNWNYEDLKAQIDGLPDELPEFIPLIDIVDFFEAEIRRAQEIEKPPEFYPAAVKAICDAFGGMPHCIFDVLRARCFFTIPHDTIEVDGQKYRLGIHTTRFTENMNSISRNIKEEREYGLE